MEKTGPLKGIRVVDLTAMVMGPYSTQIMADMGADVIKIEPPNGDQTRYVSTGRDPGLCGVFINVNRGKRSVVLDLTTEHGKTALTELIKTADVFIHSMRAKAVAKLGFCYDRVKAIKSDIVYTNCYGYGRAGPYADRPAYDDTIQAECALNAAQFELTGEANFVGTIMADKVAGLTVLYATVMALFHRCQTGEGQEVEVGMFETMAAFMLAEHADKAIFDPPLGGAYYHRAVAKNRRPYKTKDGHIAALVYNDKHWALFTQAVKPNWATPELAKLADRAKRINEVYGLLAETFLERSTAQWLDLLTELGIPASPLRSADDLFEDEHLKSIGFFENIETPSGKIRFPGVPTNFSQTPGKVHGPAPALGENTDEILAELNLNF
ncbi:CaiB/BaiF CoA transferase family protein [Halioxenophilus aromaticivorans]|uniref:CoA transferase n=1 Tax=Halioxenophilus aromaticivorans TaxID=1306992 RepID=A0AAV3TX01_9ALTE